MGAVPGPKPIDGGPLKTPALVIFDCDGVLVDTEPITLRVMTGWVNACGVDLTIEEVTRLYKGTDIKVIEADVEKRLGRPVDPALGGFAEEYRSRMFAEFENGIDPVRGAAEALDTLARAGIPWCVASNAPRSKMAVSLKAAGLGRFFADEGPKIAEAPEKSARVFSAYDIEKWKPEPDLFMHACREMTGRGGGEVATSVVIEDSKSGVIAAKAGGFRCVGIAEITPADELLAAGADVTLGSMTELPGVLGLPAAPADA